MIKDLQTNTISVHNSFMCHIKKERREEILVNLIYYIYILFLGLVIVQGVLSVIYSLKILE
jgi:hypothetical protein